MTDVSYIVIAYNEADRLENTLRSISAQRDVDRYEVIVVDDCSSDDTSGVAERYASIDPAVRVVRHSENAGRGAGRASGIAEARGRHIAMVDADIVLPPNWYRACAEALNASDAVAGTAVPDGDVQLVYNYLRLRPKSRPATTAITGNNALFRREVFERVSFDPSLRNGEDVALSHALESAGFRTQTLHSLTVRHEEGKGFRQSLSWMLESGVGATRQFARFRQVRQPDVAFAAWVFASGTALARMTTKRSARPLVLPLGLTLAASVAHLRGRFFLRQEKPGRVLAAIALNAVLLTGYFSGRLAGIVALISPTEQLSTAHEPTAPTQPK